MGIVKYLIEKGVAPNNVCNCHGITPFIAACRRGYLDILKILMQTVGVRADVETSDQPIPIIEAAAHGHTPILKYFYEEIKADITKRNNDGFTTFHAACRSGHLSTAVYLWNTKRFVSNDTANGDVTPIVSAAQNGYIDVVKFLYEEVGVECSNNICFSLLFTACRKGFLLLVRYFIEVVELDVNRTNNDGQTPFLVACMNGHIDVVRYLREIVGVDITVPTPGGFSPFCAACHFGHVDIAKYLTEEVLALVSSPPVSITERVSNSYTALHYATRKARANVVEFLLSKGVSIHDRTRVTDFILYLMSSDNNKIFIFLVNFYRMEKRH
jgi:ankyrin repeat protein